MAFVYILRSGSEDLFKIGRTRGDLEARIKQLSTGNPYPLTVFDVIETDDDAPCETYLHGSLRSRRCTESGAREFFSLTTTELEEAIRDARRYLEEDLPKQKEADRLAEEESDGRILRPGDEEWETYRGLLQACQDEHHICTHRARLENELKLTIGKADGLDGVATWKSHLVTRFDATAFKRAEPDLYQTFLRESRARQFHLL
jgi:hypothetical protein